MSDPPKLLDCIRMAVRARHYSIRTEEAYVSWARRDILFHGKKHPFPRTPSIREERYAEERDDTRQEDDVHAPYRGTFSTNSAHVEVFVPDTAARQNRG